jgi:hypothetical protein
MTDRRATEDPVKPSILVEFRNKQSFVFMDRRSMSAHRTVSIPEEHCLSIVIAAVVSSPATRDSGTISIAICSAHKQILHVGVLLLPCAVEVGSACCNA